MKYVLAALCLWAPALPAWAQPTTVNAAPGAPAICEELPPAPRLPNGAVADANEMRAGDAAYQAWVSAYQAGLACRRDRALALEAAARAMREDYNGAAAALNAATDAWRAQTTAFAARAHHSAAPAPPPRSGH